MKITLWFLYLVIPVVWILRTCVALGCGYAAQGAFALGDREWEWMSLLLVSFTKRGLSLQQPEMERSDSRWQDRTGLRSVSQNVHLASWDGKGWCVLRHAKENRRSFVCLWAQALKMKQCPLKSVWNSNHGQREQNQTIVKGSETNLILDYCSRGETPV